MKQPINAEIQARLRIAYINKDGCPQASRSDAVFLAANLAATMRRVNVGTLGVEAKDPEWGWDGDVLTLSAAVDPTACSNPIYVAQVAQRAADALVDTDLVGSKL